MKNQKENAFPISNTEEQQQFKGLTFRVFCTATFSLSPAHELAGVEACLKNLFQIGL